MVIITFKRLREFIDHYPDSKTALFYWYNLVQKADWKNISDIKRDFNSVDYVGNDRYVFNVKGNQYRLVVMIHFDIRTVYVRFIGDHGDYDKTDVKNF